MPKLKPFTPVMEKDYEISAEDGVVTIKIHCGDAYEASVLREDIAERLQSGKHIVMAMKAVDQ